MNEAIVSRFAYDRTDAAKRAASEIGGRVELQGEEWVVIAAVPKRHIEIRTVTMYVVKDSDTGMMVFETLDADEARERAGLQ